MPNPSHRIKDTVTGKEYPSKAAAGRDLAHLLDGDRKDQFVWFRIAATYPDRFRVLNHRRQWVRLNDPTAPIGTLRPGDVPVPAHASVRMTTLAIDERKYGQVRAVLGTTTLRETVDRSFDEVLVRSARAREVERLRKLEGLDLDKPAIMRNAWR